MSDHEVDTFVESLLSNRAPNQFAATLGDRDMMRLAITLRARRSEGLDPEPAFVEELHRQLASDADVGAAIVRLSAGREARGGQAVPLRRISRRVRAVAEAAAAAVLVAGTFTATHLTDTRVPVPVAQAATNAHSVRSGVLLAADGRSLGRAETYGGNPTWVFMDVQSSGLSGDYACLLQLANGSTVPAGVVTVYNGAGDWAHTVKVPASELRGAILVASNGAVMAQATFS